MKNLGIREEMAAGRMKSLRRKVDTAIKAIEAVRDDPSLSQVSTGPVQMGQALEYLQDLRDRIEDKQHEHNKAAAARRIAAKAEKDG